MAAGFAVTLAYWLRPDALAALTIFPAWGWLPLAAFVLCSPRRGLAALAFMPWLLHSVTSVEEWRSCLRTVTSLAPTHGDVRVMSLNATGAIGPVEDALGQKPDILLLQESPLHDLLQKTVNLHPGYTLLAGIDASVIVRGQIEPLEAGPHFTAGRAEIDGLRWDVCSLRLATSQVRTDLWRGSAWRAQRDRRRRQRDQLRTAIPALDSSGRAIVGGDFNVPQGDGILDVLQEHWTDAFEGAGEGLCNTIPATLPLLRIDQVWISRSLIAARLETRSVAGTDHRATWCELKARP